MTREAIDSYAGTLRLDPNDIRVENNLYQLLTKSGLLDETLATWRKNAAANPGSLEVCGPLCVILEKMGRLDESLAVWGKWAAGEEARETWTYVAWTRYADTLARANKPTEAEAAYRKVVEIAPPTTSWANPG
jgi:tetratricopeptide (TPR) repeat protein